MATYASFASRNNINIRKALEGSLLLAPYSAVAVTPATLFSTDGTGLASARPTGYSDFGFLTTDGLKISDKATTSETDSFGSVDPTRIDVTKEEITLAVTPQEQNLTVMAAYFGVDPTTIVAAHTTGIIDIQKPTIRPNTYYRALWVCHDSAAGDIYPCFSFPRVNITDLGDLTLNSQNELQWPMTFTAYADSTLGYSMRFMQGGSGNLAQLTSMNITQASS